MAGPAALVAVSLAALLVALAIGGGAAPQLLEDPGSVVRYGLPTSTMLVTLSASGMIGALGLVLFVFPAGVLIATLFAVSLIGDALRDAVDPTSGVNRD